MTPGTIPQSNALAEATPTSITEYLSKDPFEMTRQDRHQIVSILRDQRKRWEAVEAAGGKPKAGAKAGKTLDAGDKAIGDLGL